MELQALKKNWELLADPSPPRTRSMSATSSCAAGVGPGSAARAATAMGGWYTK
jgi:hypothetical protein